MKNAIVKHATLWVLIGLLPLFTACPPDPAIPCQEDPCETGCPPNPACSQTFRAIIDEAGAVKPSSDTTKTSDPTTRDSLIDGADWKCTTIKYDIEDGREDFALFNPNAGVFYPGNLLQGATLDKATPDEIVVKRAGGTISYDLIGGGGDPSFKVDEINLDQVRKAMTNIINNSNGALPANFSLSYEEVQSIEQMAFQIGISVKNLIAQIGAELSFSLGRSYSRFLVKLNQQYFTMEYTLPTNLDELFAPEVTPQDLQRYVGPGNPATYVSSVTYGRIFYMLIESTESAQAMRAAIEGSLSSIEGKKELNLDASYINNLSNLKIKVIAFGGDSEGTFDLIGETNLNTIVNLLGKSSGLRYGVPISYKVRNVSDNRTVSVRLATSYNITECHPVAPGLFEFLPQANLTPTLSTPYTCLLLDVNGDEISDVVLNHKRADRNELQVGLGDGQGGFKLGPVQYHPVATPAWNSWTNYGVKTGDVNGDGRMDLVWNNQMKNDIVKNNNVTYIGLAQTDGSFDLTIAPLQFPASWGKNYQFFLGDVNGDGWDDIIWNELVASQNRTYTSLSKGDHFGERLGPFDDVKARNWALYQAFTGDINGDGRTDLLYESKMGVGVQDVQAGIGQANGAIKTNNASFRFGDRGFETYDFHVGDIDGDGQDDVVMTKPESTRYAIWKGFPGGDRIVRKQLQYTDQYQPARRAQVLLLDADHNGRQDILFNERANNVNKIKLGLAGADGTFSFATVVQEHPDRVDWSVYEPPKKGDVNGDRKPDVIWVKEGNPLKIAVAIAH